MALHPFQSPLDRMIDYLSDVQQVNDVIQERLRQTTVSRRVPGTGQPAKLHSSLNPAVVAAVGALEVFDEDLALRAQPLDLQATPPSDWYQIDGNHDVLFVGYVTFPHSNDKCPGFWSSSSETPVQGLAMATKAGWKEAPMLIRAGKTARRAIT